MNNNILFIVAAGVGSRMNSLLPKALFEINGIPNIQNTINLARPYFNHICIVANEAAKDQWSNYKFDNTSIMYIKSGRGDGHAVREALKKYNGQKDEHITICWGDLYFLDDSLFEMTNRKNYSSGLMPVTFKINPYVTILHDSNYLATGVDSSKYGEIHGSGFQDNGIFSYKYGVLLDCLDSLHYALNKNDKYITSSGELFLTHSLHYLYNIGNPVYLQEVKSVILSYNTQEELSEIKEYVERKKDLDFV